VGVGFAGVLFYDGGFFGAFLVGLAPHPEPPPAKRNRPTRYSRRNFKFEGETEVAVSNVFKEGEACAA